MSITAPATAARGSTITLQATMENPDRIGTGPANTTVGELGIAVRGATSGDATFRPANFIVYWSGGLQEWCWLQGNPQTAATTHVS